MSVETGGIGLNLKSMGWVAEQVVSSRLERDEAERRVGQWAR